ncbi:MAG: alcohol dehydrogenase AdhP [Chlorobiaceae bacterium]|nr:alcohol dehydrogenase AdhP [Chlorobiaceae bacterium]
MLPKKMKAAVVHEFGKPLMIDDVAVPRPGYGQVLVKIVASGVCHTDLHAADGDWPVKPKLPLIPGHEGVGFVAAVGADVKFLKEGDRVGVPWLHSACGVCEYCLSGWETLCHHQQNTGYSVNGGYAEYVSAPAAYVGQLPDNLDFTLAAPILCAGVTTYKGIKETDTKPGDWIVIVGVGGLGHVAVQYAKSMGLHVAAVDICNDKLKLAKSLGAEIIINAKDENPGVVIQKQIGGAHGVLVTAVSKDIFRTSLDVLRRGGTCALVGLPPGDFPTPIFEVVLKRITIRGSIVGTRKDLQECLQFAAEGKIVPTTETQPLEAINDVFTRMKQGKINGRVVLSI